MLHRHLTNLYLGFSVPTNNQGSIVSFAIHENGDPVFERSNARHDFYQSQLKKNATELAKFTGSHGRPALLQSHRNAVKGAKGPCIFRSLSRFDVGRCFLFDSLHNLYLGLFVSRIAFNHLPVTFGYRNAFSHCGLAINTRMIFGRFFQE